MNLEKPFHFRELQKYSVDTPKTAKEGAKLGYWGSLPRFIYSSLNLKKGLHYLYQGIKLQY